MKNEDILEVWIEAEQGTDNTIESQTSDVLVHTIHNRTWVGTFITLSKAKEMKVNSDKSEKQLWLGDMIPVESLDRKTIEAVIKKMIDEDSFNSAFCEYDDYE